MEKTAVKLSKVHKLHNREYFFEECKDGTWVKKGEVTIFPEEMFINHIYVENPIYDVNQGAVKYSFGAGNAHKSGCLYFDESGMSFLGSYSNKDGTVTLVRGNQKETVYETWEEKENISRQGKLFTIGTFWNAQGMLEAYYKLDDEDISSGTVVTKVDRATWETTIERTSWGMQQYDFTFCIVVDFTGTQFQGGCTYQNEDEWKWTGKAKTDTEALMKKRSVLCGRNVKRMSMDNSVGESCELTLQNLLNISQYAVTVQEGKEIMVDMAQQETGVYFQDILINSLPQEVIKDFFGTERELHENVKKTKEKYQSFYADKALMNMGQLLYETFYESKVEEDQEAARKIDIEKIKQEWREASKDPKFGEQANELYCDAYANVAVGLKPYLKDKINWSEKLYEWTVSEAHLNIWRAMIASGQFSNVKQQIYEFYTKLIVLDRSEKGQERAKDAVCVMFSAVLNVAAQKICWLDEYREQFVQFLKDAVINMREGNIKELKEACAEENAEEIRKNLEKMISIYDSIDEFVLDIVDLITFVSKKPEAAGRPFIETIDIAVRTANGEPAFKKLADGFGKAGLHETGKLLRVLGYASCMGLCFFLFTSGDSAETIVKDVGLALCSTTFFVKGMGAFMETALAKWISEKIGGIGESVAKFCENFGKWFSSEAEITGAAAKIFGKNAEAFMKTRLGPVCAIATIVLSGFFLKDAIELKDTFNIVMESLNVGFAVADLAMLGLSALSVSWAGPAGIACAAIGAVVVLVQLIYNYFHPKHEQDKVEKFIYGPLKEAGYVKA